MTTTAWNDIKRERPLSPEGRREYERTRRSLGVAEQIRTLRLTLGLTQEELADRLGTSQSFIARLEGGGSPPTLRTLERIAEVVNADLSVRLTARKIA